MDYRCEECNREFDEIDFINNDYKDINRHIEKLNDDNQKIN